jgi:UDP:flavonoid glycosyltransferase YjiC (YdhE family)
MTTTILFAWELGSGLGYVMRLRRVAARLLRRNVEVIAVLQDVSSARWLDGLDLKVMQAPVWPATFKRDAERERLSSATFADTLADFGLADAEALRLLMAAWDQLFNLIKPDLVIAEGAPIASLTARGRIPLALVGTGSALPPAKMERFPLLHQASAPVWREEDLLDIVNRALRRIGSLPLDRLPQMFAADVRMVTTFPLLDPYCAQRTEPAEGPFFDRAPLARREEAETVLAYFSTGLDTTRPELIDALRSIASQLRIFAPGFSAGSREILSRAGARVEARPMPLAEVLAESRLVIHPGSAGTAAQALAAGVPQWVLSIDIEKDLTGGALEGAGIGALVRCYDPAASISSEAIAALESDAAVAARAMEVGRLHRQALSARDPLSTFERACLRLAAV